MNSTLPPDPYKLLGVTKDAKLPEIRSAHRKLVLKCHPDKVQDADLKAIKQDEFQKVQQAYELLSDDTRRLQYDEQVKLFELRKEMGRGNPTPRSNPFEYEVKTAEPRPNSYNRPAPKVYTYPTAVPRSHEDLYEEPLRHMPRKSASNESASERKRASAREEERYRESFIRKQQEDERLRQREKERDTKRAHSEKKKSRDKDRKRGTEEKVRARAAYVDDDSSDDDYRASATRAAEKKAARHRMEEDIRLREEARIADAAREAARAQEQQRSSIKEAPLDPKWSEHRDFAGKYMQAARRKVAVETEDFPHPGLRRAETFAAPSPQYNIRYAAPPQQFSDEDSPRRSSAPRKESRRSSETQPPRTEKPRRRSPHAADPYIVEPPSPTSTARKPPPLQSYSSAPPVFARKEPSRSKTQDYPRKDTIPPLPRAQTFQSGDRGRERGGGSRLKKEVYTSDSEPDSPMYTAPRHSHSPPPRRAAPEPTRYVVENGRTVPVASPRQHRSEMRNLDGEYTRERSESPRGTPSRPPLTRNPPSGERPRTASRSHSTSYYQAPEAPEPIVLTARPKLAREGSSHRGSSRNVPGAAYFDNVKYGPKYGTEHVIYATHPAAGLYDTGRRGSEGRDRDYYTSHQRGGSGVYA